MKTKYLGTRTLHNENTLMRKHCRPCSTHCWIVLRRFSLLMPVTNDNFRVKRIAQRRQIHLVVRRTERCLAHRAVHIKFTKQSFGSCGDNTFGAFDTKRRTERGDLCQSRKSLLGRSTLHPIPPACSLVAVARSRIALAAEPWGKISPPQQPGFPQQAPRRWLEWAKP